MTAALVSDALARLDDGTATAGDRTLTESHDRNLQARAFVWPVPLCQHRNGGDCNSCFLDWEALVDRSADL
jgi:hypothetical protein